MKPRVAVAVGIFALLVLLVWAVSRLFELRYKRGDVYPQYSSLRADPLGTKAIFDAYSELPGFELQRNFRPLVRLKPEQPVTLVYLGIDFESRWMDDELREFESLVTTGTRAVFAFQREFKIEGTQRLTPSSRFQKNKGAATPTPTPVPSGTPAPGGTPLPKPKLKPAADEEPGIGFDDVAARWGFAFDLAQDEDPEAIHGLAEPVEGGPKIDAATPWHSALYFKGLDPKWKVIARCNGVPVIAERAFGKGSIIIASDSYFVSNEAMRTARSSSLLALLFGPPRVVVFDEEHLGVTESMNIVGLARKHGLEGAVVAVLFVVALFLWKNAAPFLPSRTEREADDAVVSGVDAAEGFVHLLRRSVPRARIFSLCVEEWRKARGRRVRPAEEAVLKEVLAPLEGRVPTAKEIVTSYRAIARKLEGHR